MKTLIEILQLSSDYLKEKNIGNPRRQAEELIADALGIQRMQIYLEFDRPLVESELNLCRQRIVRKAKGEPWQYIVGKVEFYDCLLKINPDVLIPRQETEILVDKIVKSLEKEDLAGKTLWDVCCGSGCIGIALKKRFPALKVALSDFSQKALKLAKENAESNGVDVEFYAGDLLAPFKGMKTDFFVCNPPYVSKSEFLELETEVRDHEPYEALVSGPSGLEFYERLGNDLKEVLNPKGRGWMEIGTGQGSLIEQHFTDAPWKTCWVEQDWSGHDRFFFLEIE